MRPLFYLALAIIYFLPAIIARWSDHPDSSRIARLNLILGWTVCAWVAAFNWSLHKPIDFES